MIQGLAQVPESSIIDPNRIYHVPIEKHLEREGSCLFEVTLHAFLSYGFLPARVFFFFLI